MIDTHAHLDFKDFDEDREEVVSRFFESGGRAIVNVGVDLERSRKSVEIAEKHENVFASVGLHPESFSKGGWGNQVNWKNIFEELKKLAGHEKVVAIGETGLDYLRIRESGKIGEIRENQKKGFLAQIEIAQKLNLPVIVHCRNAWSDLFEIVSCYEFRVMRFVLHCYSGETKDTEKFLKLPNVYFSFSGNITYPPKKSPSISPFSKGGEVSEIIKMIPLGRLMLDSDSPFLAPQEVRGKRNEPAHIRYIAEKIAEIKGISVGEVEKATDENAENFFNI